MRNEKSKDFHRNGYVSSGKFIVFEDISEQQSIP